MRKRAKPLKNRSAGIFLVLLGCAVLVFSCANQRAGAQFERGQKLHSEGAYLEAIRNWEIILSYWPKSKYADQALHSIGTTYYVELGQPERGVDAFSRLVRDYPDSVYAPEDQVLVAEVYRSQRQYAKALAEYYRFLRLFPDNARVPEIWYRLVTCLFEVGEYNAMRVQAGALTKKYPDNKYTGDCIFWIAESYYLERDYEKARAGFTEYLKKYPQGEMAYKSWLSVARSLEEDGHLKDAIQIYIDMQKRYPQDKVLQARLDSAQKRYNERFGAANPKP
jgi:TolA-binding protein